MAKLIRLSAVQERIGGLSRSTIWRLERDGLFPRRRVVSTKIIAWDETEIEDWIRSRCRGCGQMANSRHNADGGMRKRPPQKGRSKSAVKCRDNH